jgi:ferrous iron transport protein B
MSSFAGAVPGVMASRTIENRRDRFTTLLVAPLMSCSARLPVYLLLIGAFVPATEYLGGLVGLQGLVLFGMSSLGALVAVPTAWILKKTLFRGETPPFVMELPSYKWPSPRIVLGRVYDRAKAFVVRAGTLIFATSVVVWAAGYFPGDHSEQHRVQAEAESFAEEHRGALETREGLRTQRDRLTAILDPEAEESAREAARVAAVEEGLVSVATKEEVARKLEAIAPRLEELDRELVPYDERKERLDAIGGDLLAGSVLGQAGHAIEPLVRPLGWDWRIGIGAIASFPAREVIIATLGTIYSLGGDVDEENPELKERLRQAKWPDGRPVYGVPVAMSLMVFFALCAQCAATLMTIQRETNSWRWPLFTFGYMTTLAYLAALVTYQVAVRW